MRVLDGLSLNERDKCILLPYPDGGFDLVVLSFVAIHEPVLDVGTTMTAGAPEL